MLNLRSISGQYLLTRNRVSAFSKKVFQMDRGSRYPDKLIARWVKQWKNDGHPCVSQRLGNFDRGCNEQESPRSRCQFTSMFCGESGSAWFVYLGRIALISLSFSPFWKKMDSSTARWIRGWSICWPAALKCNLHSATEPQFLLTPTIALTFWNLPSSSSNGGFFRKKVPVDCNNHRSPRRCRLTCRSPNLHAAFISKL